MSETEKAIRAERKWSVLKNKSQTLIVTDSNPASYFIAEVVRPEDADLIAATPDLFAYAQAESYVKTLWEIGEECYGGKRPQSDYWDALAEYFPQIAKQCPLHTPQYIIDWFGEEKTPEEARWELYFLADDEDSASGMIHQHIESLRTAALAKARGEAQ